MRRSEGKGIQAKTQSKRENAYDAVIMPGSHPLIPTPLPGSVRLVSGRGDLPCLDVATPHGAAQVYLHGGHVTAWHPSHADRPVLWMSERSYFQRDKPIRGGVPVCFPWFGPHPADPGAPAHGFARIEDWTLSDASESGDGSVVLVLTLEGEASHRAWPYRYRVNHRVEIGTTLKMTLEVHNPGDAAVRFEEALHTYFAVSDIEQISIAGLRETEYLDKAGGMARRTDHDDAIRFAGETDRVYEETGAACVIDDPGIRRRIVVTKSGSRSTVVWNPWIDKARAMADFGDAEWRGMVCVETANVGQASVILEPGGIHAMAAAIAVERFAAASAS